MNTHTTDTIKHEDSIKNTKEGRSKKQLNTLPTLYTALFTKPEKVALANALQLKAAQHRASYSGLFLALQHNGKEND